jgi:hypothetical protein
MPYTNGEARATIAPLLGISDFTKIKTYVIFTIIEDNDECHCDITHSRIDCVTDGTRAEALSLTFRGLHMLTTGQYTDVDPRENQE